MANGDFLNDATFGKELKQHLAHQAGWQAGDASHISDDTEIYDAPRSLPTDPPPLKLDLSNSAVQQAADDTGAALLHKVWEGFAATNPPYHDIFFAQTTFRGEAITGADALNGLVFQATALVVLDAIQISQPGHPRLTTGDPLLPGGGALEIRSLRDQLTTHLNARMLRSRALDADVETQIRANLGKSIATFCRALIDAVVAPGI